MSNQSTITVKTTQLRAYPGWVVREYRRDGETLYFDATDEVALSMGVASFAEAVSFAKSNGAYHTEVSA
jgi:hypothetical protein